MSDAQSTWHLDGGRALTLAGGAEARRLSVARGRVWLTLSGTTDEPAEDKWLEAGEAVALAPGQTASSPPKSTKPTAWWPPASSSRSPVRAWK